VYLDYSWQVWPDYRGLDLDNGAYGDKIFGDGLPTVMVLEETG